eukprot:5131913-Prymnesium_polylepis.1
MLVSTVLHHEKEVALRDRATGGVLVHPAASHTTDLRAASGPGSCSGLAAAHCHADGTAQGIECAACGGAARTSSAHERASASVGSLKDMRQRVYSEPREPDGERRSWGESAARGREAGADGGGAGGGA